MAITKRHHFLPVFYLKRFTNQNGQFYIYDVKKRVFKGNGRLFYPTQQFYRYKANTVGFSNVESDFIEGAYSNIDSKVSQILHKIHCENSTLTQDEITLLQYFINVLYWRNPVNENKLKEALLGARSMRDFGMKLMKRDSGQRASFEEEQKLLEKMKADPDTFKLLKLHTPAQTYPEIFKKDNQDYATIVDFPYDTPSLISDNPFIYKQPGEESLHTDEFVFPLSPKKWLFRHKVPKFVTHTAMKGLIDLMGLIQADAYVATTDKEYPIKLQRYYEEFFSSADHLRSQLFRLIIDASRISNDLKDLSKPLRTENK